jgi:hypothetical protein
MGALPRGGTSPCHALDCPARDEGHKGSAVEHLRWLGRSSTSCRRSFVNASLIAPALVTSLILLQSAPGHTPELSELIGIACTTA